MKTLSLAQLLHHVHTHPSVEATRFEQQLVQLVDIFAQALAKELGVKSLGAVAREGDVYAQFAPGLSGGIVPPLLRYYDDEGQWKDARRHTVLICDDERTCFLGRVALEACGLEVLTTTYAENALGLLAANGIDLLIVGMGLRGDAGMTLIEKARESRPARRLPIITLSGPADAATDTAHLHRHHVLFHAPKPMDWATLAPLIRDMAASEIYFEADRRDLATRPFGVAPVSEGDDARVSGGTCD